MSIAKIEVYMRPTCKDCKEMVKFVKALNLPISIIDITTSEGYLASKDMELCVLPTVLLKDANGDTVEWTHCVDEIKRVLEVG